MRSRSLGCTSSTSSKHSLFVVVDLLLYVDLLYVDTKTLCSRCATAKKEKNKMFFIIIFILYIYYLKKTISYLIKKPLYAYRTYRQGIVYAFFG